MRRPSFSLSVDGAIGAASPDVALAPTIDTLYAYIATDAAGREGVCTYYEPALGAMLPMIAGDKRRLDVLRPKARSLAACHKLAIRLVLFTRRVEVETVEGVTNEQRRA